jgi:hypothetical protein
MARVAKKKTETQQLEIQEIKMGELRCNVLGTSAMIMHRFPFKAWQELILPSPQKNRASLEQSLKHDPLQEYRSAFYVCREKGPTMFHVPNGAFHGSLAQAAIDIPGAKKAQIERLTKIVDVTIELYGVPQIFSAMVRNSDMNRTPDVRTRPIFPQWACRLTIQYMKNVLTERTIGNLLGAAGVIVGIGDWRGEKGGPFGSYRIVPDSDRDFRSIVKTQGRNAQHRAFDRPTYYDQDTSDILEWFRKEVKRREMDGLLVSGDGGSPPHSRVILERGNGSEAQYEGEEAAA